MLRRPALLALLVPAGLALACGPTKPTPQVDGWALARAALVDGESCYADNPAYCITDPAFVDAAIQSSLDAHYDGEMPKRERNAEQLIRSARVRYYEAMQTPEALAQITELVAAHYAAPDIDTSEPGLVNVDLGALPGTIVARGRLEPQIVFDDSPLLEDFWWQSAEAGRVLARYAAAHPERDLVRVELMIPRGTGLDKHLAYRYFRDKNRIAFGKVGEPSVYVSEPIVGGLESMAAGELELGHGHRTLCTRPRSESARDWCPWRDTYAEAKRAEAQAR